MYGSCVRHCGNCDKPPNAYYLDHVERVYAADDDNAV